MHNTKKCTIIKECNHHIKYELYTNLDVYISTVNFVIEFWRKEKLYKLNNIQTKNIYVGKTENNKNEMKWKKY